MVRHPAGKAPRWGADGGNGLVVETGTMIEHTEPRAYLDLFVTEPPTVQLTEDYLKVRFGNFLLYLASDAAIGMVKALQRELEAE